jgi:hypothetical protein
MKDTAEWQTDKPICNIRQKKNVLLQLEANFFMNYLKPPGVACQL